MLRKILCDLRSISFPLIFVSLSEKYFQLKSLKAVQILSREQMQKLQ